MAVYAGWMCSALLRECEELFRRHAEGTDAGECSTIDFIRYAFSLLSQEYTEEQEYAGNTKRGVAIYRRINVW